jgi:hypothetical protein
MFQTEVVEKIEARIFNFFFGKLFVLRDIVEKYGTRRQQVTGDHNA